MLVDRIAEVLRAHDINKKPFWGSWDEWSALMAERIAEALADAESPSCHCRLGTRFPSKEQP